MGVNKLCEIDSAKISFEIASSVKFNGENDFQPYGNGDSRFLIAKYIKDLIE
uniref:hypothetical protein n=1 Tax=Flavobacterium sp. TaxID=239 RepID=UPI004047AD16